MSIILSIPWWLGDVFTIECIITGSFLLASLKITLFSVSTGCVMSDHWLSGWCRNLGPFLQISLVDSSFAVRPQEWISAGLTSPGQCLHDSLAVKWWISSTRCPTYCFHIRLFLIQQSVVIESVHNTLGISVPRDLSLFVRWAKIRAPNNFRRGIVCLLIGATLVLEATSRTSNWPSL